MLVLITLITDDQIRL